MEEEQQMSITFDVEMRDKSIVEVSMLVKVYSDMRHSLAFDRVQQFNIQQIITSFREQIEKELRNPSCKTCGVNSSDG